MACANEPITDASDCGSLCLCVCLCDRSEDSQIPKCPNWHIYNLAMTLTGCAVTDPDGSLLEILLSMTEVTADYFVWTRPRLPGDTEIGNVTIKTSKDVDSEKQGECATDEEEDGPTASLTVRYISVTTDSGKLVYEWDEEEEAICKTSGPVGCRIASIGSNWTILPAVGDVCCMSPKVVRRIWDERFIASYTLEVEALGAEDGSRPTCAGSPGGPFETVSKCNCMNTWSELTDPARNSFGELVDGFYLSAHFETDPISMFAPWAACGIVDQVGCCGALCVSSDCDSTANLSNERVTIDLGPQADCMSGRPTLLFSPTCNCCPAGEHPNTLRVPVNYAHVLHCCENFDDTDCTSVCTVPPTYYPEKCPEGEGTADPTCPFAYAHLRCACPPIPEEQTDCDSGFLFPTCPIEPDEWIQVARDNEDECACKNVVIQASE